MLCGGHANKREYITKVMMLDAMQRPCEQINPGTSRERRHETAIHMWQFNLKGVLPSQAETKALPATATQPLTHQCHTGAALQVDVDTSSYAVWSGNNHTNTI